MCAPNVGEVCERGSALWEELVPMRRAQAALLPGAVSFVGPIAVRTR